MVQFLETQNYDFGKSYQRQAIIQTMVWCFIKATPNMLLTSMIGMALDILLDWFTMKGSQLLPSTNIQNTIISVFQHEIKILNHDKIQHVTFLTQTSMLYHQVHTCWLKAVTVKGNCYQFRAYIYKPPCIYSSPNPTSYQPLPSSPSPFFLSNLVEEWNRVQV